MSISRNTTYNIVGSALPILLSLATVPAYIKLIGVDRYGVLAIAWLLLGYFGLFDLGLGRATMHRIASLKHAPAENRLKTLWNAIVVNLGMGVIGGALLWGAAHYFFTHQFKVDPVLQPEMAFAAPLLALSVPIATLTGVLMGALQGCERFAQTNKISVLSTTLFQLGPLAVAFFYGPNLSLLLAAAVATRLASMALLWRVCRREFGTGIKLGFDRSEALELLKYGGWVTFTAMISPLLVVADRFAIGAIAGAAAVSYYTVPFQLAQRIAILPTALMNAMFPRLTSAESSEVEARLSNAANRALASVITVPVMGVIFIAEPFLHIWLGADFASAASLVTKLLVIGFWINAFALVPYARLQARGQPDRVAFLLMIQLPPYLLGLYMGLKMFGLVGCAVVFVARCALDFLLLSFTVGRETIVWAALLKGAVMLALALAATERWGPADEIWWGIAVLLLGVASIDAWLTAPDVLKAKLGGIGRRFSRI